MLIGQIPKGIKTAKSVEWDIKSRGYFKKAKYNRVLEDTGIKSVTFRM